MTSCCGGFKVPSGTTSSWLHLSRKDLIEEGQQILDTLNPALVEFWDKQLKTQKGKRDLRLSAGLAWVLFSLQKKLLEAGGARSKTKQATRIKNQIKEWNSSEQVERCRPLVRAVINALKTPFSQADMDYLNADAPVSPDVILSALPMKRIPKSDEPRNELLGALTTQDRHQMVDDVDSEEEELVATAEPREITDQIYHNVRLRNSPARVPRTRPRRGRGSRGRRRRADPVIDAAIAAAAGSGVIERGAASLYTGGSLPVSSSKTERRPLVFPNRFKQRYINGDEFYPGEKTERRHLVPGVLDPEEREASLLRRRNWFTPAQLKELQRKVAQGAQVNNVLERPSMFDLFLLKKQRNPNDPNDVKALEAIGIGPNQSALSMFIQVPGANGAATANQDTAQVNQIELGLDNIKEEEVKKRLPGLIDSFNEQNPGKPQVSMDDFGNGAHLPPPLVEALAPKKETEEPEEEIKTEEVEVKTDPGEPAAEVKTEDEEKTEDPAVAEVTEEIPGKKLDPLAITRPSRKYDKTINSFDDPDERVKVFLLRAKDEGFITKQEYEEYCKHLIDSAEFKAGITKYINITFPRSRFTILKNMKIKIGDLLEALYIDTMKEANEEQILPPRTIKNDFLYYISSDPEGKTVPIQGIPDPQERLKTTLERLGQLTRNVEATKNFWVTINDGLHTGLIKQDNIEALNRAFFDYYYNTGETAERCLQKLGDLLNRHIFLEMKGKGAINSFVEREFPKKRGVIIRNCNPHPSKRQRI